MRKDKYISEFKFNENSVTPPLEYKIRHEIIEGKDGVDYQIRQIIENSKKSGKKLSDDELDNYWWKIYRELLKEKGYRIQE